MSSIEILGAFIVRKRIGEGYVHKLILLIASESDIEGHLTALGQALTKIKLFKLTYVPADAAGLPSPAARVSQAVDWSKARGIKL